MLVADVLFGGQHSAQLGAEVRAGGGGMPSLVGHAQDADQVVHVLAAVRADVGDVVHDGHVLIGPHVTDVLPGDGRRGDGHTKRDEG